MRIHDDPYPNFKSEVEAAGLFLSPVVFSIVFDESFPLEDGTNVQVQCPGGFPQDSSENIRNQEDVDLMPYEMIQL